MKRFTRSTSLAALALLAPAPAWAGGTITQPVAVTIENNTPPPVFYRSLLLFPVDQEGNLLDTVRFDTSVTPGVFSGDESSTTPRPVEFTDYLDEFGGPGGDQVLRIFFGDDDLAWNPGEVLTFRFSLIFEPGTLWKIDAQFSVVPAPGSAGLAALAGLTLLRRRRR